ncbi:MAG TPA: DUF1318 domain-containing protein [Methylomirabilota bacterium]|jgi:uncharacterized protein YdbL (DUF1318 family)
MRIAVVTRVLKFFSPGSALLLAGCLAVTVNVHFPQEKIDSAASSIEDLVRAPKQAPTDAPAATPPRSEGVLPALASFTTWLQPAAAEAQVPELKTRTPEVMAVIQSRSARYPQLAAEMTKGCIGENNQGLVEARSGTGCSPDGGALVGAENADRMKLYQTLVQQNSMPPGDIARVQAAFARQNRERVEAGTWIQDEGGQWRRK